MKQNEVMMTALISKRGLSPIVAGQIGKMSLLFRRMIRSSGAIPFSLRRAGSVLWSVLCMELFVSFPHYLSPFPGDQSHARCLHHQLKNATKKETV